MPVDTQHSRFGDGSHRRPLGQATLWDCPACGKRNEGRVPEQGCLHCGAGDPSKATAGARAITPADVKGPDSHLEKLRRRMDESAPAYAQGPRGEFNVPEAIFAGPAEPQWHGLPKVQKIYRLLEYTITRPAEAQQVLRESLVGTIETEWGTLTGCIVDTLDPRQEDRLRMAKLQPGVWLRNITAMATGGRVRLPPGGQAPENPTGGGEREVAPPPGSLEAPMEMPDTGPQWSATQDAMAKSIIQVCGHALAHTISLGLSQIAEELAANIEPEKFITREDALALANAILHNLPKEWLDQPATPPEKTEKIDGTSHP